MLNLNEIFDPDDEPQAGAKPGELPAEWHFLWDERAAIQEHDGGLPRERAEAEALAWVIAEMKRSKKSRTCPTSEEA